MITKSEILAHQAERSRDLEIAACPANHPDIPLRLQSRFRNRGSLPRLHSGRLSRDWGIAVIALLLGGVCHADLDSPKQVRVSIQYIEMAHPAMTELLGGGEKSGHAIHAKALELAKTGDAKILDTTMVIARSGQKATVESICEQIYPTEYEPPGFEPPKDFRWFDSASRGFVAFETRNTGITLEIEPTLGSDGVIVDLRFLPEFVRLLRDDIWMEHKDEWGVASLRMPVFEKWSANTSLNLMAGKFELASVINPKDQAPPPAVSRRVLLFVRADVIETPVSP